MPVMVEFRMSDGHNEQHSLMLMCLSVLTPSTVILHFHSGAIISLINSGDSDANGDGVDSSLDSFDICGSGVSGGNEGSGGGCGGIWIRFHIQQTSITPS